MSSHTLASTICVLLFLRSNLAFLVPNCAFPAQTRAYRANTHSNSNLKFPALSLRQSAKIPASVEVAQEHMKRLFEQEPLDEEELSFLEDSNDTYKVGYMSVVGSPNAGKSTLINAILGDKLSIVSPKPQTTRREMVGVLTTATHQLIVRDTPGVLKPKYALQASMMQEVRRALSAADVYLLLIDVTEPLGDEHGGPVLPVLEQYARMLNTTGKPVLVGLNKIDQLSKSRHKLQEHHQLWQKLLPQAEIQEISALHGTNVQKLLDRILSHLPEGPLLYPNNSFTDATERFYASEIIREQLFLNYKQEVPYSCEVVVNSFKDSDEMLSISGTIFVAQTSQVPIVVGSQGQALKKVLRSATKELESVHGKPVSLHLDVRVASDWNTDPNRLRNFGYDVDFVLKHPRRGRSKR